MHANFSVIRLEKGATRFRSNMLGDLCSLANECGMWSKDYRGEEFGREIKKTIETSGKTYLKIRSFLGKVRIGLEMEKSTSRVTTFIIFRNLFISIFSAPDLKILVVYTMTRNNSILFVWIQ